MLAPLTERRIEQETLDLLPADDPRASASRGDLQRVNWVMAHTGLMAAVLGRLGPPSRLVELGAGDGTFLLGLARRLGWRGVEAVLIDLHRAIEPRVLQSFARLDWKVELCQGDLHRYICDGQIRPGDLVLANLVLHHFEDPALREQFVHLAARARGLVACEPRRSRLALEATRLLWMLGCNPITRSDGRLSVQAGFRQQELSRLWPADCGWSLHEKPARLFTHLFVATRPEGKVERAKNETPL